MYTTWSTRGSRQPSANLGDGGRSLRSPSGAPAATQSCRSLFLLGRQPAIVDELAMLRISVPGGHAIVVDHFQDRVGPAGDFVVAGHGERSDFALSMTFQAVGVQDGRHVLAVRHLGIGLRLLHAADKASQGGGGRLTDLLVGQQLLDGLDQILAGGLLALAADEVLIVNAPVIAHAVVGVEQKDFRGARGPDRVGHLVADVFQQRKLDVVRFSEVGHLRDSILSVGVDADKGHAAIAKSLGQLAQPWGIQRCQGALDTQKRHDHGPLALHVGKREILAAIVAQREGSDLLADLPGDGLRVSAAANGAAAVRRSKPGRWLRGKRVSSRQYSTGWRGLQISEIREHVSIPAVRDAGFSSGTFPGNSPVSQAASTLSCAAESD